MRRVNELRRFSRTLRSLLLLSLAFHGSSLAAAGEVESRGFQVPPLAAFAQVASRVLQGRSPVADTEITGRVLAPLAAVVVTEPRPTRDSVFVRGDTSGDGVAEMVDAVSTLSRLFGRGEPIACLKAADVNDDGEIDISDPMALLGFLFLGARPPAAPFPTPGPDPTEDSLPCRIAGGGIERVIDVDPLILRDRTVPPRGRFIDLHDHQRVEEILARTADSFDRWGFEITLAGGELMIDDCLGVKLTLGQFILRFASPTFEVGPDGVLFEFHIDRVSLTALRLRVKPRNLFDCGWSDPRELGGTARNIRFTVRFSPRVHVDDCLQLRLGDLDVRVSIGDLDVSLLPDALDEFIRKRMEEGLDLMLRNLLPGALRRGLTGAIGSVVCEGKVALYKTYMAVLSAETALHPLPQVYIDLLAPYYPNVDLNGVTFGHSDNQPADNATTDCSRMYFNDREMVEGLQDGSFDINWNWLLHELRHTEQCVELGGRDAYARRWFRDLELSLLSLHLTQDPAGFLGELHDRMPMEGDAQARADAVESQLDTQIVSQPLRDTDLIPRFPR